MLPYWRLESRSYQVNREVEICETNGWAARSIVRESR